MLTFGVSPTIAVVFADIHLENGIILSNGNLQQGSKLFGYKQDGGGDSAPIIFTNNGSKVIRLQTSATPHSEKKDRAELIVSQGVQHRQTYYLGFKFYIPHNEESYPHPSGPDDWFILTQLRQNTGQLPDDLVCTPESTPPGCHSPSLSIELRGDKLVVVGRHDKIWLGEELIDDGYEALMERSLEGLYNQWLHLILSFNLDDDEGKVTLWFNGEQPQTTEYDLRYNCDEDGVGEDDCEGVDGLGNYLFSSTLKFGVYRSPQSTPYFINFDDYRLGQWYSEVKSW